MVNYSFDGARLALASLACFVVASCVGCASGGGAPHGGATPAASPVASATPTAGPTTSATPVASATPIASATPTATATAAPTASATPIADRKRPCDLYAAATPCVAAFSMTRALYDAYAGALYRVTRASDGTSKNVGLLSDGYANAAAQNAFCANTTCTVTAIFDQSANHNTLLAAPPGGNARGSGPNGDDLPAIANALPISAGGHGVYGLAIDPGMGYRDDTTTGIATMGRPEGVYMVTSTQRLDGHCCFDFGNAETTNDDNGAGNMDAMNIGCRATTPCSDLAGLDMENGVYGNLAVPSGTAFVTAMGANDGQHYFTIWQGDAQSGGLTSTGSRALPAGYAPMKQQGAIILGIGGDNSDGDAGDFFEGVMTQGTPTNAVMKAVQANIVSVGYTGL